MRYWLLTSLLALSICTARGWCDEIPHESGYPLPAEIERLRLDLSWNQAGSQNFPVYERLLFDGNSIRVYALTFGKLMGLYYPAKQSNVYWYRRHFYVDTSEISTVCMWIGGIKYPDTIVAHGYVGRGGGLFGYEHFRVRRNDSPRHADTVPDLEFRVDLTDTGFFSQNLNDWTGERLPPLGLRCNTRMMAWRKEYLSRTILFDNWIVNISSDPITDLAVGVFASPRVFNGYLDRVRTEVDSSYPTGAICGFLPTVAGIVEGTSDSINLMWVADNDGDAFWSGGTFGISNPTGVMGIRILYTPKRQRVSFNWWVLNSGWGPRRRESMAHDPPDAYMEYSDQSMYRLMTNGEVDYDQPYAAADLTEHGWLKPPPWSSGQIIARGLLQRTLLSAGPLESPLYPGDSIRFTYAIVMGDDFHTDPNHFVNTFDYNNPAPYLNGLNFTNLISAAQWAGWFFDNPGVDTDGDGYAGEFYLVDCRDGCDSVYYSGDGVPDFKGPLPPPPPDDITYETFPTKIIARWTGKATEFARDRHMRRPDWEGYNVYLAVDDTAKGWSLVGSWDRQDYVRYSYHGVKENWIRNSQPHTVEEWRQILSDPEFDPRDHSMPSFTTAYFDIATDTVRTAAGTIVDIVTHDRWSYFGREAADHQNEYEDNGRMHPNPIQQVGTVDTLIDGQLQQYGIYEHEIDDLSQSKVYWLTVSAFDYGDYRNFIDPEESVPGENAVRFVPVNSADVVVDSGLKVNVHPNPYKAEFYDNHGNVATYHSQGYEYSPSGKFDERDRRIWFTNLPDTAVIEIYSLDGDLIRIIRHPDDFLTKYQSVVGWDLISRNTQAVTSGIYIWKVTSRLGSQVGKLVIIK